MLRKMHALTLWKVVRRRGELVRESGGEQARSTSKMFECKASMYKVGWQVVR